MTPHNFSLRASLELLKANGCAPRTLFDVDVATGTTGFYGVFDDVRYMLVDPLAESEPFMRDICSRYPGVYEVAAAGASNGEAEFTAEPGLSGSSFFRRAGERRTVAMFTLDALVEKHALAPPFLVKLDVQGFELEVLKGFEQGLRQTEAIVAEASFWADRKGNGRASFPELVAFMTARDFVLYDIAGLARRPRDGAWPRRIWCFCAVTASYAATPATEPPNKWPTARPKRRQDLPARPPKLEGCGPPQSVDAAPAFPLYRRSPPAELRAGAFVFDWRRPCLR